MTNKAAPEPERFRLSDSWPRWGSLILAVGAILFAAAQLPVVIGSDIRQARERVEAHVESQAEALARQQKLDEEQNTRIASLESAMASLAQAASRWDFSYDSIKEALASQTALLADVRDNQRAMLERVVRLETKLEGR